MHSWVAEIKDDWDGPVYVKNTDEIYENIQEFFDENLKIDNLRIYACKKHKCGHDEQVWIPTNVEIQLATT